MTRQSLSIGTFARRKARYGHRPWISWTDQYGGEHATRATAESLEQAIGAVGPKGKFYGYCGDGTGVILNHAIATIWLSNARIGCLS